MNDASSVLGVLDRVRQVDAGRRIPLEVVLREEGRQHFRCVADRRARVKGRRAEHLAAAHEHERDAEFAARLRHGDHVGVRPGARARHDLARLHVGQRGQLVAQHRRALEVEPFRGAVHLGAEARR